VVASGRLEVLAEPSDGQPPRVVATRDVGEYFGEMSLLTGAPRPATVRALEDTELAVLTRDVLRPVLVSDPPAAERLSQTLAARTAMRAEAMQRLAAESRPPAAEYHASALLGSIQRFFRLAGAAD
jgi:CRP-like cAMP-binding protein